ncbi:DUF5069 domain-containing protein [Candidatus Nitrospira salsa]|nr:MAG: hypothetical protein NPIRA01_28630 [Nitrospirales bacterium]
MKNEHATKESEPWIEEFTRLYETAVQTFANGVRGPDRVFSDKDTKQLAAIGATPQEIYDFVEDWHDAGEPDFPTVLRITAVRRDYFLREQHGNPSDKNVSMNDLPSMSAVLGGYRWLPRIIEKAKAKLQGEMPRELMYGCGGDRPFLRKIGIDPAEFLQVVWETRSDEQQILDYVKHKSSGPHPT